MGKSHLIILLVIFGIYAILQANFTMINRISGRILILFFVGAFAACGPASKSVRSPQKEEMESSETFFNKLFKDKTAFGTIVSNKDAWNVQVIYTKIDRNSSNKPRLTTYSYNERPGYFYPASTVKFPIAILSLQKLNELKMEGIEKNTTMLTEAAYSGQTPVYNDPNTADGRPTIENYLRKIFLVSDNDASNRLYEFLGQEYVNRELHKKGYGEAQILHRLSIGLTEDENRHTNPVKFYDSSGKLIYSQELMQSSLVYQTRKDFLGKGYYANGSLVNAPMDFSKKNRIDLASLHKIITSLIFPGKVKASERFRLTENDRNFLLEQMSMFPGESVYPSYDTTEYYKAYAKFIFYGSQSDITPGKIRIFNKVGNAYGQLIDVAYFCDFENKVEFFVSAAITCNTDGILNDDKYDYSTIGYPFMKNLGEALYAYELKRTKKHLPDLSSFVYRYNK